MRQAHGRRRTRQSLRQRCGVLSERRAEFWYETVVRVRIVSSKTMQLLIEPYRSRTQSMSAW